MAYTQFRFLALSSDKAVDSFSPTSIDGFEPMHNCHINCMHGDGLQIVHVYWISQQLFASVYIPRYWHSVLDSCCKIKTENTIIFLDIVQPWVVLISRCTKAWPKRLGNWRSLGWFGISGSWIRWADATLSNSPESTPMEEEEPRLSGKAQSSLCGSGWSADNQHLHLVVVAKVLKYFKMDI